MNTETKISENKQNKHAGHRSRVDDKVLAGHISSFTDIELVEAALFFVRKRSNTNINAHDLLDQFGSLSGIFSADIVQIMGVEGAGEKTAIFLTVMGEVYRRMSAENTKTEKRFSSIEQVGKFFIKKFKGINNERVMLLALDNKLSLIDCKTIHEGEVSSSSVSFRKVIKTALDLNAARIIIAHNHPSGDASPSDDDIVLTRTLRRALAEVDVDLTEHILVADDRYMPLISYIVRASEMSYVD